MGQIIQRGKDLIRINPKNNERLQSSPNNGSTWMDRYSGNFCGEFQDLTDNGKEILATTSKGLYYSKDEGRQWFKK